MKITLHLASLSATHWYEYAERFVLGGLITGIAGVIAKIFGPAVGGLFLAFPAIFPAGATLIEKHELQKRERTGLNGAKRAAAAVSIDAAGAAMGSIGLAVFAALVWRLLPSHSAVLMLASATLSWLGVSVGVWRIRKKL